MKRTILLCLSTLSLCACASLTSYFQPQPAFDWTGQNFDDYILSQGTPAYQYMSPSGSIIYSFKKVCQYDPMKKGETLVVVGADNLIQKISNPTKCPSYYESPAYERERQKQEMEYQERQEEQKRKERIKAIENHLRVIEIKRPTQESTVKAAESDLNLAQQGITWNGRLSVTEYENILNQERVKLEQLKNDQINLEREKQQLESIR